MAIKSKIKKIFLVILLVAVFIVLSAVKLFSGQEGSKTSQAQAQCWTPHPVVGSCSGCLNGVSCSGGASCAGSCGSGCGSCY